MMTGRTDAEWFAQWGGSHYDPRTREMVIVGERKR